MRKFEKISTEIKKLSQEQKEVKQLRKPSCLLNNPKLLTPVGAQWTVNANKYELRHLFQAYAILKGIERPKVKKPSNYNGIILNEKKILEMVETFKPVEVLEEV